MFGETYYTERYLKVLTLCALSDDSDSDVSSIFGSQLNRLFLIVSKLIHNILYYCYSPQIVVDPKDYHRVNLARALYSTASTLILDEPLVRLAPNLQEQFFFES